MQCIVMKEIIYYKMLSVSVLFSVNNEGVSNAQRETVVILSVEIVVKWLTV